MKITENDKILDGLFREAVAAIDAGDVAAVERMLAANPELADARLDSPGAWLRDRAGGALDGFFKRPYLLWFVAEDPVRNGKLPPNIADVARAIIQSARRNEVSDRQEQVDHALRLVCWSWIARDCGVQIKLIDVLLESGASFDGSGVYQSRFGSHTDAAIYNGNFAAAAYLLERGAPVTLSTALCLGRWADVERLVRTASLEEKQDAFVLAALGGRAEGLRKMIALGMDPTTVSARNQSHGMALHHAVWSRSLDAVKVLVEAGADLDRRDTIYNGTPLGWAKHAGEGQKDPARAEQYAKIAEYLASKGGRD